MRRGIFDAELGDRILAEAVDTIADLEHRRTPFDEPWHAWRPVPTRTTPTLLAGWEEVW